MTVVVVGAGTMGRGIAGAAVAAGLTTTLVDVDADALERARASIARHAADAATRLSVTTDLGAAASGAEAVVEAVPEVGEIKRDVLGRLRGRVAAGALVATNTSTMSISALAGALDDSPRFVGMHFFNPVHRMPLVEIAVGRATSDATVADAVALAERLGKDPIVVRDVPGFVTSRLGLLLGNEAMRMVEEGVASAADIDKAMRLGYRHPMGPLELADLVGLDARLNNVRSMYALSGAEAYRPPRILERLVAEGCLGRKSGAGFYDYDDDGAKAGPREVTV